MQNTKASIILEKILDFEQENRKIYKAYVTQLVHPGLRHLLSLILNGEEEHEKRLKELINTPNIDLIFDFPKAFNLESLAKTEQYSNSTNFNDILHVVMKREEATMAIYTKLAQSCSNKDVAFILNELAFEEKKHYSWAVDQYELVMLSE